MSQVSSWRKSSILKYVSSDSYSVFKFIIWQHIQRNEMRRFDYFDNQTHTQTQKGLLQKNTQEDHDIVRLKPIRVYLPHENM